MKQAVLTCLAFFAAFKPVWLPGPRAEALQRGLLLGQREVQQMSGGAVAAPGEQGVGACGWDLGNQRVLGLLVASRCGIEHHDNTERGSAGLSSTM